MGFSIQVLRCEDLIILKFMAERIIDLADAAELLRANQATIEFELLDRLATQSDTTEQLEQLKQEANR